MQPAIRSSLADLAILILAALALRIGTFGHPNLFIDEAFYTSVGTAMHHGAVPYVDVWDRKPFGLFALYWLFTAFTPSSIAYQIAAMLFAGATAWVIGLIARPWATRPGRIFGGALYLLALPLFQGFGGQSPVFYNLFVALAVLGLLRGRDSLRAGQRDWRIAAAMLLAGLAITIKTTALFEALFIGLYAAGQLRQSALPARAVLGRMASWMLLGALPTAMIAAGYGLIGHWPEWWQAMVGANLVKGKWHAATALAQARTMALVLLPFAALALFSGLRMEPRDRRFMGLWLVAALAGLVSVPNFHAHYALPLLVPLCAAAAGTLSHPRIGPVLTGLAAVLLAPLSHPFKFAETAQARAQMDRAAALIRTGGAERGLLVYQGPPYLYVAAGAPFPTPLAFPPHLNHAAERNASTRNTLAEIERVLATRPGVVVTTRDVRDTPLNDDTAGRVSTYVALHCRNETEIEVPELLRSDHLLIWRDCH